MTTLFVTSSGTDIGKTTVCCRLLEAVPSKMAVRCIKPVVTGFDPTAPDSTDTAQLLEAQGLEIDATSIEATSPWRFRAPLSADMAAKRQDSVISFDELVAFSQPPPGIELNLIEGIGGVMAPIDDQHTVLDWIGTLDAKVLLVVGSYLGSLSHTLTAVGALSHRAQELFAIVISQSTTEPVPTIETAASLEHYCGGIPITIMPRNETTSAAAGAALIEQWLRSDKKAAGYP